MDSDTIFGTLGPDFFLEGTQQDDVIAALDGDDTISARNGNDTLVGGLGNDLLRGGRGDDVYIYNLGDGQDVITDAGDSNFSRIDADTLIINGYNSSDATFDRFASVSNLEAINLIIDFGAGDSITIANTLEADSNEIEEIIFADDGVVFRTSELQELLIEQSQTTGDDEVIGFSAADDTLEGGLGNDTLSGLFGDDTYIFNRGDGQDIIDDEGFGSDNDSLIINGHNSSDATFSRDSQFGNGLVIDFDNGDSISIIQTFNDGTRNEIEEVVFADDSVTFGTAELQQLLIEQSQTTGDDEVIGFNTRDDTLEGGVGDDELRGLRGDDTYIFNLGDGQDTINDSGGDSADSLIINDYNFSDASFGRLFNNTLVIDFGDGDAVELQNGLAEISNSDQIEEVIFSDITLTTDDLQGILLDQASTDGDDEIIGFDGEDTIEGGLGNDTINGREGNDTLSGGVGNDTFVFDNVAGETTVRDFTNDIVESDILDISVFAFTDIADLQSQMAITEDSGDTRIQLRADASIVLEGVAASTLDDDDFIFV